MLPAFSGHLPCSLKRAMPSLVMRNTHGWEGFNATCFLDPTDGNFSHIGHSFLTKMIEAAGGQSDHVFSADQFNEMAPASKDLTYLRQASQRVYEIMASIDPDAKWVMQGWFLVTWAMCHESPDPKSACAGFWWQEEEQRAYLSGVPKGKLLILDLDA